jgi:cell wall-associated NlpC family hydrolase
MLGREVVSQARKYRNVRFKHQGRTIGGLDCVGLILRVGVDLSLLPTELLPVGDGCLVPAYNARPHPRLFALVARHGDSVPLEHAAPGDVLILHFDTPEKKPEHIVIKTDCGIIHVHPGSSITRITEHSIDQEWQRRILCAFRFRGVEAHG